MVYVGLDGAIIPPDFPLHHQILVQEPLGEGNSLFLSLSPEWDRGRAPGRTSRPDHQHPHRPGPPGGNYFSTSPTSMRPASRFMWSGFWPPPRECYPACATRPRSLCRVHPSPFNGLPAGPGVGWVVSPQTSLFNLWGPRLATNLWLAGDSIFPGQSTAAVALGGLRVANDVHQTIEREEPGRANLAPYAKLET
jgi:hypothetical protein